VVRGRNLYPQDLEAAIESSHEGIASGTCACFTVPAEGDGQGVAAVVEVERARRSRIDTGEVIETIRGTLAERFGIALQACVLIRPASALKTSSGKIRRQPTREAFLEDRLQVMDRWPLRAMSAASTASKEPRPAALDPNALARRTRRQRRAMLARSIQAHLAHVAGFPEGVLPATDMGFAAMGIDSLTAMQLKGELEEMLGVRLPASLLLELRDIDELAGHLAAALDTDAVVGRTPTVRSEQSGVRTDDLDTLDDEATEAALAAKLDALEDD